MIFNFLTATTDWNEDLTNAMTEGLMNGFMQGLGIMAPYLIAAFVIFILLPGLWRIYKKKKSKNK